MRFNDRPVALGTGTIYVYGRDPDHNLVKVEDVNAVQTDPSIVTRRASKI